VKKYSHIAKGKKATIYKGNMKKKHSEIFSYVYSGSAHSAFSVGLHGTSPMSQINAQHTHTTFCMTGLQYLQETDIKNTCFVCVVNFLLHILIPSTTTATTKTTVVTTHTLKHLTLNRTRTKFLPAYNSHV